MQAEASRRCDSDDPWAASCFRETVGWYSELTTPACSIALQLTIAPTGACIFLGSSEIPRSARKTSVVGLKIKFGPSRLVLEEVADGDTRPAEWVTSGSDQPHSGQVGDYAIQRGTELRGKRSSGNQSLHKAKGLAVRDPASARAAGVDRVTLDPAAQLARIGRQANELRVVRARPPVVALPIAHHAQVRSNTLSPLLGEDRAPGLIEQ